MSASEWAKYVARRGFTSTFVPEADRGTAAGRTRAIEKVLDAYLQETLVAGTETELVNMRLEKASPAGSVSRYRFVVLGRKKQRATT